MPKIYISPSTQEKNITAIGASEEELMHKIADALVPLLKDNGYEILRARKTQTLQQMIKESNDYKADIHIAIHSNAYNTVIRGAEVFYYSTSVKGKQLAADIYKQLLEISPVSGRGIKTGDHLAEIAQTNAPAVLMEVDFHDNPAGAMWINNNIVLIAEAIAKGVSAFYGKSFYKSAPAPDDKYKELADKYKAGLISIQKIVGDLLGE